MVTPCKSVQPFSRNVADKETNKETKKERKKSLENNTPSSYRGRGNYKNALNANIHARSITPGGTLKLSRLVLKLHKFIKYWLIFIIRVLT